nr:unnamed protein product [Callosobruchus analis]
MKSRLMTLQKKAKTLQTTVGTLRERVKSLNSLLKLLKQKMYITDSAETALKVWRIFL